MDQLIERFQEEVQKSRQKFREQRLINKQSDDSEDVFEVTYDGYNADLGLAEAIKTDGSKIYVEGSIPGSIGTGDRFKVCKSISYYEFFY